MTTHHADTEPEPAAAAKTEYTLFHTYEDCSLGSIYEAGRYIDHVGTGLSNRTLDLYSILFLLEGNGHYKDATGASCDLQAGDFLLVMPRVAHHYGPPPGKTWNESFVLFRGPVFNLWRRQQLLSSGYLLKHLEPITYWRMRMEEIADPSLSALQRVCKLQMLLADVFKDSETAAEPPFIGEAKHLLEDRSHMPLKEVARQTGRSYDSFRKEFSQFVGMPPAQYRSTQLIKQACGLLRTGALRNNEIADQLGFCDEYYFSRRFHQLMGCSPSEYRKHFCES